MASKTVSFTHTGVSKLPKDKPVICKIQTDSGKTIYVGTAKRGRVQDRILEHLTNADVAGSKVQIEQMPSIEDARKTEQRIIARVQPKYNEQGK
ncbi:MAG: GIY-YIG nuclease family protein [Candidatus Hydrogenedentes bacterium]|nr:GIY-YIG nuclease family protein [Candidatus Hydrogenedentota bacterium]